MADFVDLWMLAFSTEADFLLLLYVYILSTLVSLFCSFGTCQMNIKLLKFKTFQFSLIFSIILSFVLYSEGFS